MEWGLGSWVKKVKGIKKYRLAVIKIVMRYKVQHGIIVDNIIELCMVSDGH